MLFNTIKKIIDNNPEDKVVLFLRHAEKNIDGLSSLTARGVADTIQLAYQLQTLKTDIYIFSSPEPRCEQTAKIIHSQLSNTKTKIRFSNALGKPGLQILDNTLYTKLYAQFKCREIFHQWKNGLHYDALRSPEQLKKLANTFFETTSSNKGITLYISQSGSVASLGYALNLIDYQVTEGEWVNFLDGFILTI